MQVNKVLAVNNEEKINAMEVYKIAKVDISDEELEKQRMEYDANDIIGALNGKGEPDKRPGHEGERITGTMVESSEDYKPLSDAVRDKWVSVIDSLPESQYTDKRKDQLKQQINGKSENNESDLDTNIYKPLTQGKRQDSGDSLDDMLGDADEFVNNNNETPKVDTSDLQQFIGIIYNILLTVGIIVSVIMGAALGVKFMTSSVEGRAEVKSLLIPYVVGCVVVFGAFGIWKIAILLLQNV